MKLGAHESIAGGLFKAFERAENDGCQAVQIFTQNQNRWIGKSIAEAEVTAFKEARQECGIDVALSHGSYLINLCASDEEKLVKSRDAFSPV